MSSCHDGKRLSALWEFGECDSAYNQPAQCALPGFGKRRLPREGGKEKDTSLAPRGRHTTALLLLEKLLLNSEDSIREIQSHTPQLLYESLSIH